MTQDRVFISRTILPKPLELLQAQCDVHVWEADIPPPRDILFEQLALADGLLAMLTEKIDREALTHAPRLRVISNHAVGYDNIDIHAATERGIPVGNTPDVLTETTADHAFALLLAAARRLPESMQYIRDGKWQTWNPTTLLGQEVHGSKLGIIGFGRIGAAVARRALGFGMRILYCGGRNQALAQSLGAEAVDLSTLLRASDFVSLHVPLKADTYHLIEAEELALMKKTAILINTARGGVVQPDALVHALQTGQIAGAALDVTEPEPIPLDHALLTLPNCIVLPHTASATYATREKMGILAAQNLLAGLRGERLPHCVNPQVYENSAE